eukprot:c3643_g1_i1.p1 GENE.c3643_g1_i1~~c3643_g1_i1.p1  ORF type:complete len:372 (-),score=38.59 c3643_g1_i1:386-1501(-)
MFLPARDILKCSTLSRKFYSASLDEDLWFELCSQYGWIDSLRQLNLFHFYSWKQLFMCRYSWKCEICCELTCTVHLLLNKRICVKCVSREQLCYLITKELAQSTFGASEVDLLHIPSITISASFPRNDLIPENMKHYALFDSRKGGTVEIYSLQQVQNRCNYRKEKVIDATTMPVVPPYSALFWIGFTHHQRHDHDNVVHTWQAMQCNVCSATMPPTLLVGHALNAHKELFPDNTKELFEKCDPPGMDILDRVFTCFESGLNFDNLKWNHRIFMDLYPHSTPSLLDIDHKLIKHVWNLGMTGRERLNATKVHMGDIYELFLRGVKDLSDECTSQVSELGCIFQFILYLSRMLLGLVSSLALGVERVTFLRR